MKRFYPVANAIVLPGVACAHTPKPYSPTDSVVTSRGVDGTCLPMTIVLPTQQKQVIDLGYKLRLALAGG
jgi:hypothetical protein